MELPEDRVVAPARAAPPSPALRSRSPVWRRFRRQTGAMAAVGFLGFLVALAVFAPVVVGTRPIVCRYRGSIHFPFLEYYAPGLRSAAFHAAEFRTDFAAALAAADPDSWAIWPVVYQDPHRRTGDPGPGRAPYGAPSRRNLFGTDDLGVDVFAQVVFGTRVALVVGCLSMAIAAAIGVSLGAAAGYFGGLIDAAISRAIEIAMAIPTLILVLAVLSVVERPGVGHMIIVIGLTRWDSIARFTRAEFLKLRQADFVLAARGLGAGWSRIVVSHLLPNAIPPILVPIAFGVATAILLESGLSLLGYGTPPPTASWGRLLATWRGSIGSWWLALFPSLAVFASVCTFQRIGDGLREAIDPRGTGTRSGRAR